MTDTTEATEAPVDPQLAAAQSGMLGSYWAQQHPEHTAIISGQGDRTFAELNANANKAVRALRRRGIATGDALALLCTNRPEFAEVVATSQRGGLRLTPINWHLTGGEAGYIVDDCEAKALIADAAPSGRHGGGGAAEVAGIPVRLAVGWCHRRVRVLRRRGVGRRGRR